MLVNIPVIVSHPFAVPSSLNLEEEQPKRYLGFGLYVHLEDTSVAVYQFSPNVMTYLRLEYLDQGGAIAVQWNLLGVLPPSSCSVKCCMHSPDLAPKAAVETSDTIFCGDHRSGSAVRSSADSFTNNSSPDCSAG